MKRNDMEAFKRKVTENVERADEFVTKKNQVASAQRTNPHRDAEIKKHIQKMLVLRDQLTSRLSEKDHSEKDGLEDLHKRLEKQLEATRACERAMKNTSAKATAVTSSSTEHSKAQNWMKDALGNLRQRMSTLEADIASGSKAAQANGGNNSRKGPGRGSSKLSAGEALDLYRMHYAKLERVLRWLQADEIRPEDVNTEKGEVRELLKDKVEVTALSRADWFQRLENLKTDSRRGGRNVNTAAGGGANESSKGKGGSAAAGGKAADKSANSNSTNSNSPAAASHNHNNNSSSNTNSDARSPVQASTKSLDDDKSIPAWADDDADINNDVTFGSGAAMNGGSLLEMMQHTKALSAVVENERRVSRRKAAEEAAAAVAATAALPTAAAAAAPASSSAAAAPSSASATAATSTAAAAGSQSAPSAAAPAAAAAPAPTRPPVRREAEVDLETFSRMFSASLFNLNHSLDTDRSRPFVPSNVVEPIAEFPAEVHPVLSHREIYEAFDDSSLFFIFYYHQKSYQHSYAMRELRRRRYLYRPSTKHWYRMVQERPHPPSSSPTPTPEEGAAAAAGTEAKGATETLSCFDFRQTWHWVACPEDAEVPREEFEA